jgi:uncharacterized membrane protein YhaH (DUF805 family)
MLMQVGELLPFTSNTATALQKTLALSAYALTIWGFVEIGFLRGTAGENYYGSDPLARAGRRA